MALRDRFSKPRPNDQPAPARTVVDTPFVRADATDAYVLASVQCEKYTDHEAQAIQSDLIAAAAHRAHRVVVDLSRVLMLASAGIGSLIQVHQACHRSGGKLVLVGLDPNIAELLRVARMDRFFTIVGSHADAARAIA